MWTRIVVAAVVMSVFLTGCGGMPGREAGLAGALDRTPAGLGGEQEFYYSDITAAYALGAFEGKRPYATAGGYGLGQLSTLMSTRPELLPSEEADAASAVTIGRPPHTSFRFAGVDQAGVETTLGDADGKRSEVAGGTLLVRYEDQEVNLDDELSQDVLSAMNTVWYGDDVLVGSSTRGNVVGWVDGGESLAEAGTYRGVVDCLGDDIVGAMLSADPPTLPDAVTAFGTATTGTSATEWTDVMCIRSDDPDRLASSIRAGLADGRSGRTGRPWSELLGDATVEAVGDDWVRVVTTETPSIFFNAYQAEDLAGLLGG